MTRAEYPEQQDSGDGDEAGQHDIDYRIAYAGNNVVRYNRTDRKRRDAENQNLRALLEGAPHVYQRE